MSILSKNLKEKTHEGVLIDELRKQLDEVQNIQREYNHKIDELNKITEYAQQILHQLDSRACSIRRALYELDPELTKKFEDGSYDDLPF